MPHRLSLEKFPGYLRRTELFGKEGENVHGQYYKLDHSKVLKLKRQGLSNTQIALRLGVTQGAVSQVLRKAEAVVPGKGRSYFCANGSTR